MLHILLTILKVIGIILLIIIGLIVLIAVCILFVPIRYKADISYDEKLNITAKATYLFHLISLRYNKDNEEGLSLKICGIKIHYFDKDRKEQKRKYDKDTEMFEEISDDIRKNDDFPEKLRKMTESDMDRKTKVSDNVNDKNSVRNTSNTDESSNNNSTNDEFNENNGEEIRNDSFIKRIIKNIKRIISKIKYRFLKICGTIKKVYKSAGEFKEFITDEGTKEAFCFLKKELIVLLKHIRPRKIRGYIHYGFEDPSVTGKILGVIYMLSSGTHKNFQINADFEDKVLEGEVHFKGYVQIYVLLIIAWRLYKNENLKEVLERRRTYGRE